MKKKITRISSGIIFCMVLCLLVPNCLETQAASENPWVAFMEAEEFLEEDGDTLVIESDDTAIKGKVIKAQVGENYNESFYVNFTVPKDGTYTIWGRVFYPNQSSNSLYYEVDGGSEQIWDFGDEDDLNTACYNSWHYFYLTYREPMGLGNYSPNGGTHMRENGEWRHSPMYLALEQGEHFIEFSSRENGWSIDQFVITELKVDEYDPNFFEGNDNYLESCKFCNNETWKHYIKDVYAEKNITAEEYLETALKHYNVDAKDGNTNAVIMDKEEDDDRGMKEENNAFFKNPITMVAIVAVALLAVAGVVIYIKGKKQK